jgi:hypothetical protein
MANQWLRLWHDMPTDPKWRTISRVSGQRIGDVIAVFNHLLVCASNATERGRTQSFNCEDVASALDLETQDVVSIIDAMQNRVLEGDYLKGWEKRQVAREDGSAERSKAWREGQKSAKQASLNDGERTPNATERKQTPDTDTDTDKKRNTGRERATRLPTDLTLPDDWSAFCQTERPDLDPAKTFDKFRDYWTAKAGKDGAKLDWLATWRNWVREERKQIAQRQTQPLNKQQALEERNRAVAEKWLRDQEANHAPV